MGMLCYSKIKSAEKNTVEKGTPLKEVSYGANWDRKRNTKDNDKGKC